MNFMLHCTININNKTENTLNGSSNIMFAAEGEEKTNKKSSVYGKRSFVLLLSDSELVDYSAVSFDILLLEVAEKVSSLTDHLKKTAS